MKNASPFTRYQALVIVILALTQFTVVLDFMVLSPLGAQLLGELHISTAQFGWVVSAYAFSAGTAGFITAGFADKFDRKKLLLFFYGGFIIGTLLCGIAPTYDFLLGARIVTGLFGGVIGSISLAIVSDLFPLEVRGRVMGFVQMAFAASQVLGIPVGLYLANNFGWHSPFLMIVGLSLMIVTTIAVYLQPVNAHLAVKAERNAFSHLLHTISNPSYLRGFATTTLMSTGAYMLMPFGSAFSTGNLGLKLTDLPMIYLITGIFTIGMGPLAGKVSDKIGKYRLFVIAALAGMVITGIYGNLGITPLWAVIALNIVLFLTIVSRMISSSALMSAVPEAPDRGAFMSINSSVQQLAGGIGSVIAGLIIVQRPDGFLENYDTLSYLVILTGVFTVIMMYFINQQVARKAKSVAANPLSVTIEQPVGSKG